MSPTKIEEIFSERTEMLALITPYISASLKTRLQRKIAEEKGRLSRFVRSSDRGQAGAQNHLRPLNPAFFERKSLNINFFD